MAKEYKFRKRANRSVVSIESNADRDEAGGGRVSGGREAFVLASQLLFERVHVAGRGLAKEGPAGKHAVLRELVLLRCRHLPVLLDAVAAQFEELANNDDQVAWAQCAIHQLVAICE